VIGGGPSRYGVNIYALCKVRVQSQCGFFKRVGGYLMIDKMSLYGEKDTSTLCSVADLHMSRAHALALWLLIVYTGTQVERDAECTQTPGRNRNLCFSQR
jgi:hypothetical protein